MGDSLRTVFQERRQWIPGRSRFLLLFPVLLVSAGLLAMANRPHELLAGGPLLLLLAYGLVLLILGRTDVEVNERGFHLRRGPLPAGAQREAHDKESVLSLFPRHLRERAGGGPASDHYYAAVELADGRWVNLGGPYPDWPTASTACLRIAGIWRLAEVGAGRSGFPNQRDWHGVRTVLLWGSVYLGALLWGVAVEIVRSLPVAR